MPVELEENSVFEVDVSADGGHRVLAKRIINGRSLRESSGSVRIDFEVNNSAADRVEFRAFGTGGYTMPLGHRYLRTRAFSAWRASP
jgi:hypothetical protein